MLATHRIGSALYDTESGRFEPALVTVLEYLRDGTKMYSIEAVDVGKYENSAGQLVAVAGGERQTPIAEFVRSVAQTVAEVNGVFFSTGEIDPKRVGIAKRDIEARMRELGKRPRKTRRMTWPEVYQRSEALLNQGKLDELVNSINGFGPRPLNAAETMALGVYERRLSDQYDEILRLQQRKWGLSPVG